MAASIKSEKNVKLGFIEEETDLRLLSSHFFPSKIGGRPAWLSLEPILGPEDLSCKICGGPSTFLLQVYAPLTSRCDTFHRTIFVFVCPNASCSKSNNGDNFKVFRSQLPLKNMFYSSEPPKEDLDEAGEVDGVSDSPNASHFQSLCRVCGMKGPKKCGRCKKVFYCSKDHQVLDWKVEHKQMCSQLEATSTEVEARGTSEYHERYPGIVFREFELVTEDEEEEPDEGKDKKEMSEEERLREFEMLMRSPHLQSLDNKFKTEELETAATCETEDDKQFRKFKQRISSEPTQVLRYCRGGLPLWVSSFHQSRKEDIPVCACGAEREFEFQIMPQLLTYLGVDTLEDSLDWGTICVYTCSESCSIQTAYAPEFLWKQDFENTSNNSLMQPEVVEAGGRK